MRNDRLIYFGVFVLLLITACSDPEKKASEAVAEVLHLASQAEQEGDASERLDLLERANELVLEVRNSYSETAVGQSLNRGLIDTSLSVADLELRLHEARQSSQINERAEGCFSSQDPLCAYSILTEYVELLASKGLRGQVGYSGDRYRQWLAMQAGDYIEASKFRTDDVRLRNAIMEGHVRQIADRDSVEHVIEEIQQLASQLTGGRSVDRIAQDRGLKMLLSVRPEAVRHPFLRERLMPSRSTYLMLGPLLWRAEYRLEGVGAALDQVERFIDENFREPHRVSAMVPALVELLAIAWSLEDEPGAGRVSNKLAELLNDLAESSPQTVDAPKNLIMAHLTFAAAVGAGQPERVLEATDPSFEELLVSWITRTDVPNYMGHLPRRSQLLFLSEAANDWAVEELVNAPARLESLFEAIGQAERNVFDSLDLGTQHTWGLYPGAAYRTAELMLESGINEHRCQLAALRVKTAVSASRNVQSNFSEPWAMSRVAMCFAEIGDAAGFESWGEHLEDRDRVRALIMLGQFEDAESLIVSSRSLGASHGLLFELAEQVGKSRGIADAREVLERNRYEPSAIRGLVANFAARNGDAPAVLEEINLMSFESDFERTRKSQELVSLAAQNGHLMAAFQLVQRLDFDEVSSRRQAVGSIAGAIWQPGDSN